MKKDKVEVKCGKCHYKWSPRVMNPRQCPNCKRQIRYPKVEGQSFYRTGK